MSVTLALDGGPDGTCTDDSLEAGLAAVRVYADAVHGLAPGIEVKVEEIVGEAPAVDGHDGRNVVRWVTTEWDDDLDPMALAVTVTTFDGETGRITDDDIVVNAVRYRWSSSSDVRSCSGAFDLQDVLTHELGHAFGLGHDTVDAEATMFPSADTCEAKKRDLDESDLDGLHYLYVDVGPAPQGCALAGGRSGPTGAGLVLGILVLGRRRAAHLNLTWRGRAARHALVSGLVAVLLVAPLAAQATILVSLPIEKMSSGAELALRGTVRAVATVERNGRTYSDAIVSVESCLRGACPLLLTVRQLGGELGSGGVEVEGTPRLETGGELLLFLRARRDGAYAPVGMAQGVFAVERDAGRAVVGYVRDLRGVGLVDEAGTRRRGGLEQVAPAKLSAALGLP